jgi:hypothetical protein
MPKKQPQYYEDKYPFLSAKFKAKFDNIGAILGVIEKDCDHLFNIAALEELAKSNTWPAINKYLMFFEECITHCGNNKEYMKKEIQAKLFPFLHATLNQPGWSRENLSLPVGCGGEELGFWEKFNAQKLGSDISQAEVLKQYAFTSLDMARTAKKLNSDSLPLNNHLVVELRHLKHLKPADLKNKSLLIRSSSGDKKGLSQWIVYHKEHGTNSLYSESPIMEEDKALLKDLFGTLPEIKGGEAALSMSSGIRAAARCVQFVGGAGLDSSVDFFSLLIEWVWYTGSVHPDTNKNWYWSFFKRHTLQWDQAAHTFSLLDFFNPMGTKSDNEQMQMRSYYLGLNWALENAGALTIDKDAHTVTLNVLEHPKFLGKIEKAYNNKKPGSSESSPSTRARYSWSEDTLLKELSTDFTSDSLFPRTLAINAFRACAKEATLIINLPETVALSTDEKELTCYLMEINPFVCELKNPAENDSLTEINERLQHIFARNRWLRLRDYLPPLLDEFWSVAAEYWVAYLKEAPNLLGDDSVAIEFKRCVREMGLHGLVPVLEYLKNQAGDLKPAFNELLKNVDKPPVFYAGCPAKAIVPYTRALLDHLKGNHYFPFKQFHFSFVPGVNKDIINLLQELNAQGSFDKISLTDCLQDSKEFYSFLRDAIALAQTDPNWNCPIHVPELEKPFKDPLAQKIIQAYSELNNILVERSRNKNAIQLLNLPTFKVATAVPTPVVPSVPSGGASAPATPTLNESQLKMEFKKNIPNAWGAKLSIHRSGGTSLQMQQQQQIKQERSRSLDNEKVKGTDYKDILPSLLIDYTNIQKELGTFFAELNAESPINGAKATLGVVGASVLQNFFHTWVNANPKVTTEHTISKMTPYAAKKLLRYHRQLSGGLNVANLPRGFYTQKTALGELVLGYKSTLPYSTDYTPLTMQLTDSLPTPERILGDYRQFKSQYDSNPMLEDEYFLLFVHMQPEVSYKEKIKRCDDFISKEYDAMPKQWQNFFIKTGSAKIMAHWEYFYASYRAGKTDIFSDLDYKLNWDRAVVLLMNSIYTIPADDVKRGRIIGILQRQKTDYTKALGQIYSRYGNYGLERFSNLLLTMENRLGTNFVDHFFKNYLSYYTTWSPLLQQEAMTSLEDLIEQLAGDNTQKELFETFLELHLRAVEGEDIPVLCKGFRYFYKNIKDKGLEKEFTPKVLRNIKPEGQNLFPCFERILKSLEHIPNQELSQNFIRTLEKIDLSEGGVPYAVCHDGFVLIDPALELHDFHKGCPSYKVPMEKLYTGPWDDLYTKRALASKGHIKVGDYKEFSKKSPTKDQLVWILHTEWEDAPAVKTFFSTQNPGSIALVARHLHGIFYTGRKEHYRSFPQSLLGDLIKPANLGELKTILAKYPNQLAIFDCCNLLYAYDKTMYSKELPRIISLFTSADTPKVHPHLEQGVSLATLFGVQPEELKDFYTQTEKLKEITRNELVILTTQLQSLDLKSLPNDDNARKGIWKAIVDGIKEMDAHPLSIEDKRKQLMLQLRNDHELKFKSSLSGDYRLVTDADLADLKLNQFFDQHADRIKALLKTYITVSDSEVLKGEKPLLPLIEFFKRLQLNKTYINEVEPLLSTLEDVLKGYPDGEGRWTATYLSEFLRALEPEKATGFPIRVMETLLKEPNSPFAPKSINEIQPHFDPEGKWKSIISAILTAGESFDRKQQADLASLAMRSLDNPDLLDKLILDLTNVKFDGLRDQVLTCILKTPKSEQYEAILGQCKQVVLSKIEPPMNNTLWKSISHLWIETFTNYPEFTPYFSQLQSLDSPKREQILRIMAYSTMKSHLYPTVPRSNYFEGGEHSKAVKLIRALQELDDADLTTLSSRYPGKPAPDTRDLLGFIKTKSQVPIHQALKSFLTEQQAIARQDYLKLSSAREADLVRMLELTYVTRGDKDEPINAKQGATIMLLFQYLKQLEQGTVYVKGANTDLAHMSDEELKRAFHECSQASLLDENNLALKIQIWAILFETLGRATGKYPHLAQQFALIADEVLMAEDKSSILQLKTGEGKSHFVALRAARHAGKGKKVDVNTAKVSLAERDLLDYKQFFDALGFTSANITAKSPREDFVNAQIIYATPGDLSLFLDEQASQGTPIEIIPNDRVGLGDEFDFLYYEGQKVQFNYARQTGIMPKEMSWFYRALNDFHDTQLTIDKKGFFPVGAVTGCFDFLYDKASENGRIYLESLDPPSLLTWLQSDHEAATLEPNKNYTVRLEQVKIGVEESPLREIYPLTKDMQAAVGSTYSLGVHQLLAERLNMEAKKNGESQNYHVHPESDIISSQVFSQRLKTLWTHWEGFTGTVSSSQAVELNTAHQTAILRVPTNQKDLRKWPDPRFFDKRETRLQHMVADIKKRLIEKKSILFCCRTDAEVIDITKVLRKEFPEIFEQQFISFTNASHESAADVLRRKKDMEGNYLGQKKQGVVLIAAGFGRGDNVDVETVMLTSVQDENDLGQKGGRTARNGEEGEVLQYYITANIDDRLVELHNFFSKTEQKPLYQEIIKELQKRTNPLVDFFANDLSVDNLKKIKGKEKFDLLLRLDEFIEARDNYSSVMYHEAKAMISTAGIELIGQSDVEEKEALIKGFASYLKDFEKKWGEIQADKKYGKVEDRIQALHDHLTNGVQGSPPGRLTALFKNVGPIQFTPPPIQKPVFMLNRVPTEISKERQLTASTQGLLLKLSSIPEEPNIWNEMIDSMAALGPEQMEALLSIYRNETSIPFEHFLNQINQIKEPHKATTAFAAAKGGKDNIKDYITPEVRHILTAMPKDASNLVWKYLIGQDYEHPQTRVSRAIPLIQLSKANPACKSYWSNVETRDSLLSLPKESLVNLPPLDGTILVSVKKFLNHFITDDSAEFSALFKELAEGMEDHPEQRKRFLTRYETILERTNKPKTELLKQISQLAHLMKSPEHFVLLKTLIEKMALEYQKPRVPIKELDDLWDSLLKGNLLNNLAILETCLAKEGKEFVPLLKTAFELNPEFAAASQDFLKDFFPKISRESDKKKRVKFYKDTVQLMQESFSGQDSQLLAKATSMFTKFLTSEAFANYENKKALFVGMKKIITNNINATDLFPKYNDDEKLASLLYLCKELPDYPMSLLSLDGLIDYVTPGKALLANEVKGVQYLLASVPGTLSMDELNGGLGSYEKKNKLPQLLALCKRFPDHAEDLFRLNEFIEHITPQTPLTPNELSGLQALLPYVSSIGHDKVNVVFNSYPSRQNVAGLLNLCHHVPAHAKDLLSLETLVATASNGKNPLSHKELKGIELLLNNVPGVIKAEEMSELLNEIGIDDVRSLLNVCEHFPSHTLDLLYLKELHEYFRNPLSPDDIKGIGLLLDNVPKAISLKQLRWYLGSFEAKKQLPQLFYLCQRMPEHAVKFLCVDSLIEYLTPLTDVRKRNFSDIKVRGLEALLATCKEANLIDEGKELERRLNPFDTKPKIGSLFYLCQRFPKHARQLSLSEPITSYFQTNFYRGLSNSEQDTCMAGFETLLNHELIDAQFIADFAGLSDVQKQQLFLLFQKLPSFTKKTSVKDLLPWVNYLSSPEYQTLPQVMQEASIPGMQNLLTKGAVIFKEHEGIDQFNAKEMGMLLFVAEHCPVKTENLLALKPLIKWMLARDFDFEKTAVEGAKQAIGNFLEDLNKHKLPFNDIKLRVSALKNKDLESLLDYWKDIPDHAASILCNDLSKNTSMCFEFIKRFYQESGADKGSWIKEELMDMEPGERVTFMELLKEGAFVHYLPKSSSQKCQKISKAENTSFFKTGLECYEEEIKSVFAKVDPKAQSRGISPEQQKDLYTIMKEFKAIGQAAVPIGSSVTLKNEVFGSIKDQIKAYKEIRWKDTERFEKIEGKINEIAQDSAHSYAQLWKRLNDVKRELLDEDALKVSKQIIPRMHFSAQSRLYKTLNNVEDLLIKAWVEESRLQIASAQEFTKVYKQSLSDHISSFKHALALNNKRFGLFKSSSVKILSEIDDMDDRDVVSYLKTNSKLVNSLHGTLKVMAKEVLAHGAEGVGKDHVSKKAL